jgi:enoyl-CoA hydratase/carnithine racemase
VNTLAIETHGETQIVRLQRGKSNPMDAELVNELREAIREANIDPEVKGLILTGQPGFFSVGLDVKALYDYDRDEMYDFWQALAALIAELSGSPKPWVAAINGHSPAGGCVLALCCDWRVMAEGKYRIGLNELPVGIVVPAPIYALYAHVIGERRAHQYLLEGRLMPPEEALACGLVDQVVPEAEVLATAQAQLNKYLALNAKAFQKSKQNLRTGLLKHLHAEFEPTFRSTLEHWWSPESRAAIQDMVNRLSQKAQA